MKSAQLINKTPHPVTLGSITHSPVGSPARVSTSEETVDTLALGCPVHGMDDPECCDHYEVVQVIKSVLGEVTDLPDPQPGVCLIVSRLVASACPDRYDLLVPARLVRDDQGRVIGCSALERV